MSDKYMRRKKAIIITMCTLICIMAVGYAAFATNLTITGTSSIESTWKILFTKIEEESKTSGVTITKAPTAEGTTATFNVDLTSPGDKIVYKITVANQGTIDAIINDITARETGSDAIKFEISGIKKGDKLAKGSSTTFNVTISYDSNVISQPNLTDNTLTVSINYVQDVSQTITEENPTIKTNRLSAEILKNNQAQSDTDIDFSEISSDTNGKGLYYTNINTEDNKTTYYFRGEVENNYVSVRKLGTCTYKGIDVDFWDESGNIIDNPTITNELCQSTNVCLEYQNDELMYADVGLTEASCIAFNDDESYTNDGNKAVWTNDKATYTYGLKNELWRIVRINEDGSIRLIKQNSIGSGRFNYHFNDNAYVGYMYGTAGSSTYEETHKNTNSSDIKTVVDTWYKDNLTSYSSMIADSGFCGDRSIAPSANTWNSSDTALGYGINYTIYGPLSRLDPKYGSTEVLPQFKCPQTNDLYTTATSTKGNKALTYPIGLITADEVVYAGGASYTSNANYYMSGEAFWTMSPCYLYYASGAPFTYVWSLHANDYMRFGTVDSSSNIRPVINLKSTVEITGGDGTSDNPYVIKTN